jgi:hypothetical protein
MVDRVLRAGMEVVERAFYDVADAYAVPIAEFHWVLDDTDDQLPQALCFYVQGHGDPYCLEFTARQLAAVAYVRDGADRSDVESLVREKIKRWFTNAARTATCWAICVHGPARHGNVGAGTRRVAVVLAD